MLAVADHVVAVEDALADAGENAVAADDVVPSVDDMLAVADDVVAVENAMADAGGIMSTVANNLSIRL